MNIDSMLTMSAVVSVLVAHMPADARRDAADMLDEWAAKRGGSDIDAKFIRTVADQVRNASDDVNPANARRTFRLDD